MDAGLLWTVIGSAAAVPAVVVGAWQLRLQMLEYRERGQFGERERPAPAVLGALPVAAPMGRLPVDVRGRDALLAESRRSLIRGKPRGTPWVLTGMGGLGKSTVALAAADTALARGWRVWWITTTDVASLSGGRLEVLGQLSAPKSVTQLLQQGAPTAPDRAWEFVPESRVAGTRWLLVLDDADSPAVLAGAGRDYPADGTGWLRPGLPGMVIVTTRHRAVWSGTCSSAIRMSPSNSGRSSAVGMGVAGFVMRGPGGWDSPGTRRPYETLGAGAGCLGRPRAG